MFDDTMFDRAPARPGRGHRSLPRALLLAAMLGGAAVAALAQSTGAVIYPAKGQSAQQQERDRFECYEWAKAQTGFDPTQAYQPVSTGQPSTSSRSTAGGMVTGAVGGAAVAELTKGDAGKGAAYGALGSALIGQVKQQKSAQAGQQQMAQQQAARGQQKANYDRHIGACMEGRGYTVR